jgi:tetratricopeptide (TPR) repeat protein
MMGTSKSPAILVRWFLTLIMLKAGEKQMRMKKMCTLLLVSAAALMLAGCGTKTNTKEQEAYRKYGINCIESGDYEAAVDAFQRALDQSHGKVTAMEIDICYYKAEAQYLSGDYDGAATTYQALIDYNDDAQSYFLRGCMRFQQGMQEEALSDFGMAVSREKNDRDLYIGIYEAMAANGLESEGQYYLHQALEVSGEKADDLMQRGRVYLMLGDIQNAASTLQKAIDKGSVQAYFYLAEAYEALDDPDNADACFQAYLDAGMADSYELCEVGVLLLNRGDYAHAIDYFQSALGQETVPNKAAILKNMVMAYEGQYDFASAKETVEQYLELMPEDEMAQKELTFLSSR